MVHSTIPISNNLKEKLDKLFYELKVKKKVKTWDDFINLLFDSYKVEVQNER